MKKGEWEQAKYVWECSNCGYMTDTPTHYCPSCGTRMTIPTTEHKEEDNNDQHRNHKDTR